MTVLVDECGLHTQSTIQAINSHLEAFKKYIYNFVFYDFIDLSENKYYTHKIKMLFDKDAMSEKEYIEANK